MPGVEAYDVELLRSQVLAETESPGGPATALLECAPCGPATHTGPT